jgi:hypothetical protein
MRDVDYKRKSIKSPDQALVMNERTDEKSFDS